MFHSCFAAAYNLMLCICKCIFLWTTRVRFKSMHLSVYYDLYNSRQTHEESYLFLKVAFTAQVYFNMNSSVRCCFWLCVAIFHAPYDVSKHELIYRYCPTHLPNVSNCSLKSHVTNNKRLQPFCNLNNDDHGWYQGNKFKDGDVGYRLSSESAVVTISQKDVNCVWNSIWNLQRRLQQL